MNDRPMAMWRDVPHPAVPAGFARMLCKAACCALLLTLGGATRAAETLDGRWWVVLGASPAPDSTMQDFTAANRAGDAARRCGLRVMGDFSAKFEGFAPDLYVTVAGGFATRPEAAAALARVRPCVPDAYLRRGGYAGE